MDNHAKSNIGKVIARTIASLIIITEPQVVLAQQNQNPSATPVVDQEKCYGIVKAGMNDCQTATSKCAGSSTKDKQIDAFILLPKGLCDKIVGAKKSI